MDFQPFYKRVFYLFVRLFVFKSRLEESVRPTGRDAAQRSQAGPLQLHRRDSRLR